MTAVRRYQFETHQPVDLSVEIGKGSVTITASDTTESQVEVAGRDADEVTVTQSGNHIDVVGPKQRAGFFSGDSALEVTITVPTDSQLALKTGSADINVHGTVGTTRLKSGSGDVQMATLAGPGLLETGSGDVAVESCTGELRIKSGSGDIRVGHAESAVAVSTGSGDVEIGTSNGPAAVKTGSGDLRVVDAYADVSMLTGSGDLVVGTARRGKLLAKGASGDVHIGIPAGIPVWTDLSTVTGAIRSDLEGAGEPADGADHIELRAKTVSGDIVLTQI